MQAETKNTDQQEQSCDATQSRRFATVRFKSEDLFRQGREVEIEHAGRIYRMRVTSQNKLILTA